MHDMQAGNVRRVFGFPDFIPTQPVPVIRQNPTQPRRETLAKAAMLASNNAGMMRVVL
jgi:hypothetical protein